MPFRKKVELHNGIYVVRNSLGLGTKVPGAGIGASPLVKSVDFDGLTQYATSSTLSVAGSGEFTLSFWAKFRPTTSNDDVINLFEGGVSSLVLTRGNGFMRLPQTFTRAGTVVPAQQVTSADPAWVADNAWGMFTVYFNPATAWRAYMNATEVVSVAPAGGLTHSWKSFYIGDASNPLNARVARVGLWLSDKTASVAAWAADPQADWSSADYLWNMGDGDTHPTLTDSGTTGGWDLTMVNMDPSDIVDDYPA